jgi:putative sterol carrier protein
MRLYSDEWIAAFNEAVAGLEPDAGASFRMLQVVRGGPEGTLRIVLSVHEGRVALERVQDAEAASQDAEPAPPVEVTVSMQFDDALALAQGELDPARLLAAGRVRVRGDLSVLVRGQELLAAATARLGSLSAETSC